MSSGQAVQGVQATPEPVCPLATCQRAVLLTALCPPWLPLSGVPDAVEQKPAGAAHICRAWKEASFPGLEASCRGVRWGEREEEEGERGLLWGTPEKTWTPCGWHRQRLRVDMGQPAPGRAASKGPGPLVPWVTRDPRMQWGKTLGWWLSEPASQARPNTVPGGCGAAFGQLQFAPPHPYRQRSADSSLLTMRLLGPDRGGLLSSAAPSGSRGGSSQACDTRITFHDKRP